MLLLLLKACQTICKYLARTIRTLEYPFLAQVILLRSEQKVGRSPLSSDKNPTSSFERRSNRHCHNKNCVRWYTCPGGLRRHLCPSYSNHSTFLTLSEARFRSRQFNKARRARPELSADECAILAASSCNEV